MPQPVLRLEGALWANHAQVYGAKAWIFHGKRHAQPVCVSGTTAERLSWECVLGTGPSTLLHEAGEAYD